MGTGYNRTFISKLTDRLIVLAAGKSMPKEPLAFMIPGKPVFLDRCGGVPSGRVYKTSVDYLHCNSRGSQKSNPGFQGMAALFRNIRSIGEYDQVNSR